jgi:NitT/TauT family transport system ATP-binding protein
MGLPVVRHGGEVIMVDEGLVLKIANVSHAFGDNRVLHDITLRILPGQIVSLVGPSGCGKSTLLQLIVGTLGIQAGSLSVFGGAGHTDVQPVIGPGRDRGIVYQRYSLYPFLTVRNNVALGLKLDETTIPFRFFRLGQWRALRRKHLGMADEMLGHVGLAEAVGKYPHELSGGMQQRVSVAQALVMKPQILLLDEPFGALDEATREDLQRLLLSLYAENTAAITAGAHPPHTILLVTHELNEAILVADRVVGLSQYWHWEDEGHTECPGATIVYDKALPTFGPDDDFDFTTFRTQRAEIFDVVFSPENRRSRNEFRTFWHDVREGSADGILKWTPPTL